MYTVKFLNVPAQIRALRKKQGLSQEQLAKKAGTNQPTISRLERSQTLIHDLDTLATITEALNAQIMIDIEPKKVNLERVRPHHRVRPHAPTPIKRTRLQDQIEF